MASGAMGFVHAWFGSYRSRIDLRDTCHVFLPIGYSKGLCVRNNNNAVEARAYDFVFSRYLVFRQHLPETLTRSCREALPALSPSVFWPVAI